MIPYLLIFGTWLVAAPLACFVGAKSDYAFFYLPFILVLGNSGAVAAVLLY